MLTVRDSQVRQVPAAAAAPDHDRGAARLPAAAGPAAPHPSDPGVFISPAGTRLLYATCTRRSRSWSATPACSPGRRPAARASTTCATRSRSARCSMPTPPARTCRPGCPCCPPTSATSTRAPPTGTCPPRPSCSPLAGQRLEHHLRRPAVTALAPDPAGVLHRPAGPPAPRQPAHHRRLPRHLAAAARLRRPPHRQAALPARPRRPGRAADRRVPRPPRTRARQQRPHPQRPPGRDPLAVPLRRAAPPRARRADRPGAGDPAQALRQGPGHLPHRTRDRRRCSPRRTGPPGPAGATTPCSCSPPRPGCASPS